jgi:transposase
MSLKARLSKLERKLAQSRLAECHCPPREGWDVVYERLSRKPKPVEAGVTYIPKGAPPPQARICPTCGRPRNRVIVRYVAKTATVGRTGHI